MTPGSLASVNQLRLELVRTFANDQSQGFGLCIVDATGTAIMTFKVPQEIARAITADDAECQIAMSPSGSPEVYNGEELPQRRVKIALDELIAQSLLPDMLEDELDLRTQLTTLKHRLATSLALIDRTISTLPDQKP